MKTTVTFNMPVITRFVLDCLEYKAKWNNAMYSEDIKIVVFGFVFVCLGWTNENIKARKDLLLKHSEG
jgi:hypothetical protein